MSIDRMVDVGGGAGAWAKVWEEAGVTTTLVDGDYVENPMVKDFRAHDLSKPIDLGERFDLVQTLEVAEHLPETSASDFVDTLTRHGDIVLFSAAVKGQGGEHHVNEQPVEYWRKKFAERGYACFDFLRPQIQNNADVKPWYRYNIVLFANEVGQARLSDKVRQSITDHAIDMGSFGWNVRKAVVRTMPRKMVDWVAMSMASRQR